MGDNEFCLADPIFVGHLLIREIELKVQYSVVFGTFRTVTTGHQEVTDFFRGWKTFEVM